MQLLLGDCLEIFPSVIQSASIDAVICDLPYGTTQNKWDSIIPLELLWKEYRRVCKGAVVLTAAQPFTSALVMSNLKNFGYEWIWEKSIATGQLNAKRQPLRAHESVLIFGKNLKYHPQGIHEGKTSGGKFSKTTNYGKMSEYNEQTHTGYPRSVIEFSNPNNANCHPTQKPVALMEYLIRTYTNEGDVVLDNCMGSGTTGVACMNTNRDFIGIEKDLNYFSIARERILEAQFQQTIRNAERLVSHA